MTKRSRPTRSPGAATTPRAETEQRIVDAARTLFARQGYDGVSVDRIAAAAGLSKQNLLYYFPRKELLYRRVLDGVLDIWLSYMDAMSRREGDPEAALREYIAGKLRFSFEHPDDSRIYAREVIAGAPLYADQITARVIPALRADEAVFRRWAERGWCRPVDASHLMVMLWAATQAYADYATQIGLILGKPRLDRTDIDRAEAQLVDIVLRAIVLRPGGRAPAGRAPRIPGTPA
ncbi:MAG: TetR family transcriptional regulator C-terminal domain-containing protein [Burkholderiales bacterium]|nr:TetR family transcriptional regulator C-terminal domain-containing protein [Burkholderiales bacterium]